MVEDQVDDTQDTEGIEDATESEETLNPEEQAKQREEELRRDPDVQRLLQKEADRRVTAAVRKQRAKYAEQLKKEREELERKIREDELLKEGNLEKALEEAKAREQQATQELEAYKRGEKIDKLLDKKEIVGTELLPMRELFHGFTGALEDLDEIIDAFKENFEKAVNEKVKAEIDRRLENEPPPKVKETPPASEPTLLEKIAEAERKAIQTKSPEDWARVRMLKNQLSDQIANV